MKFSARKVVNTFSGFFFGAAIGNMITNLGGWNFIVLAITLFPLLFTSDWSESLEEKTVKRAHLKEDNKILEEEVKKAEFQKQLDDLNGKK